MTWDQICAQLAARRIALGYSQRHLDQLVPNGSRSRNGLRIARWEAGERTPTAIHYHDWCTALGLTITHTTET